MSEMFDIVDENDRVIGTAPRDAVHGNPELIHRVAHVLVFDTTGRLFLQKRASTKDVQPNKWDTSVGGHVDAGEQYHEAAVREMREELGICGPEPVELYRYLHRNSFESEMATTYKVVWNGPIHIQEDEISEGRYWNPSEIDSSDPEQFTPNFLDELDRYRDWERGR